jgi:DNA-directed RNA polymerase subunit H (RpoH/RPB5)
MFSRVLKELLESRNYTDIVEYNEGYLLCKCQDPTNARTVSVFGVFNEPKLNVHSVKECLAIAEELGSNHCLIVYIDIVTPVVKKLVANSAIRIELFRKKELGYNITKHVFVPKHQLATPEERKALVKYISNIPHIRTTDAVVRFLGFRTGDIVRINRHDGSVAYRVVV